MSTFAIAPVSRCRWKVLSPSPLACEPLPVLLQCLRSFPYAEATAEILSERFLDRRCGVTLHPPTPCSMTVTDDWDIWYDKAGGRAFYQEIRAAVLVFLIRVSCAAPDEQTTRPIFLTEESGQFCQSAGRVRCVITRWLKEKVPCSAPAESQPIKHVSDEPRFVWNEDRYQARLAVQEYSRDTHADY
jgi:hypothetical protein